MTCPDCQHSIEAHHVEVYKNEKIKLGTIAHLVCMHCACSKKVELKEWTGEQQRSRGKGRGAGRD